jgi:hypothetical protein
MTKTRTAPHTGLFGRKKTLRGGLRFGAVKEYFNPPSLRKKLLSDPVNYKDTIKEYLEGGIYNPGEPATRKPAQGADTSKRDLPKFRISEGDVHAAWQRAVDAYTALSNKQQLSVKHVKAELKSIPLKEQAANLAGQLASQTGVALSNLPKFLVLFIFLALCGGVKVAAGVFLGAVEVVASFIFTGGFGNVDLGARGVFGSVGDCGGSGGHRGGGDDNVAIATKVYKDDKEAKEKNPNGRSGLADALEDAVNENVPLRIEFDRLLREAIEATQVVYGKDFDKGRSWHSREINDLPVFPPTKIEPADAAALAAVSFAVAHGAKKQEVPDVPDKTAKADDEAVALEAVQALKDMTKGAAAPAEAAPAEAAPAEAAPAEAPAEERTNKKAPPPRKAAPEGKCWTKKVDTEVNPDTGKPDVWYEQAGNESIWDLYERVKDEKTGEMVKTGKMLTECSAGGRRRRTRGGDRPPGPKPPEGGRRRKTRRTLRPFRRSTRGRRR